MKKTAIILLLFFFSSNMLAITKDSVNAVLEELDVVIADKMLYQSLKENKIGDLKLRLKNTSNDSVKFNICGDLFSEYLHYQADSSFSYNEERIHLLSRMNNPELEVVVLINRAEVMGVMGMYSEALEQLRKINPKQLDLKTLNYYYRVCCACQCV